uniref:Phosphodiesterase n=1 Tax=Ephydatia fluviatilis TaxID=31330 RepID=O96077_9METZ|nr:EFPDE3 [Ephydatia fluviatilis]
MAALLFTRHPAIVALTIFPSQVAYLLLLGTSLLVVVTLVAQRGGLGAVFARESLTFVALVEVLHFSTTGLFHRVLPAILLPQLVYVSVVAGLTLCETNRQFGFLSLNKLRQQLLQEQPARDRLSVNSVNFKYAATPGRKISVASGSADGESSMQSLRPGRHSVSSTGSMMHDMEITEANGLIGDLLLNESLSEGMEQKLRKVHELLAPRMAGHTAYTPRMNVVNPIAEDRHDHESDVVTDTTPPPAARHHVARRSGSGGSARRTSHFSTTTTSSGMPVLVTEPSDRFRSLAMRDFRARISVQEPSVHKTQRERLIGKDHDAPMSPSSASATMNFFAVNATIAGTSSEQEPNGPVLVAGEERSKDHSPAHLVDRENTPTQEELQAGVTTLQKPAKLSHSSIPLSPLAVAKHSIHEQSSPTRMEGMARQGGEEEETDGVATVADKSKSVRSTSAVTVSEKTPSIPECIDERAESPTSRGRSYTLPRNMRLNPFSGEVESLEQNKKRLSPAIVHTSSEQVAMSYQSLVIFSKYTSPNYDYLIEEYSSNNVAVLDEVANWDFPIFELREKSGDHILSQMAYCLFNEAGLMETFKIPHRKFINFFRALEAHYGNNVYHNKVHAADVLHATSYLLFEIIPEFSCTVSSSERVWTGNQRTRMGGNVASAFSILEVFATYMAAAVHDFDHPGRTNAFLVATKSPLAILYNDRAVLENHHCAASWDLLTSVPEHNFLGDMEEAELKRFRFLLVEAVLATDLKMHFDLLSDFRAKVDPEEDGGIDWSSEVDRLTVMKMIMKMADISTPTKSYELHRAWTKLITEEFYQQGEQEIVLGLPPTIFLDRKHPEKLPAVQLSFIQNLVSPLFHACAEAGVIPGVLEDNDIRSATPVIDASKTEGMTTPSVTSDETRFSDTTARPETNEDEDNISIVIPTKKFMSVILSNLQMNYEAWQAELPPPEMPSPAVSSQSEAPSPAVSSQLEAPSPSVSSQLEAPSPSVSSQLEEPSRSVSSQAEIPVIVHPPPEENSSEGANRVEYKFGSGNVASAVELPAKVDLPPLASKV